MNPFPSYFLIGYSVIGLLDLAVMVYCPGFRLASKPLIVASLIFYTLTFHSFRSNQLFLAGLVFALAGDILLIFEGEFFFLAGLCSFLVMQVIYTIAFLQQAERITPRKFLAILALAGIAVMVLSLIKEKLGNMIVPVLLYSFTICSMVASALLRAKSLPGYHLLFAGAVLFLISDAFLAYGRFGSLLPGNSLVVMITYMTAQYVIVTSYTRSKKGYPLYRE